MNRCGTQSLWTPAVAISPKEQTNHPGFQIWAGYSVSHKLKDPSLRGAHECSTIMPAYSDIYFFQRQWHILRRPKEKSRAASMNWQPSWTNKHTYPRTFTLTTICCLPPCLYLTLLPFPFLCQAHCLLNHPHKNSNNQCSVNPSSYLFPWLLERQRTELWEMLFFFLNWSFKLQWHACIAHLDVNLNM